MISSGSAVLSGSIVGSAETVEGTARWIEGCTKGIPAKESRQPNLFPPFPGIGPDETFRCELICSDELQRVLPTREIVRLASIPGQREMTRAVVEAKVGKGRVVLFGADVTYRAQPVASFRLLFAAIRAAGRGE